MHVWAGISVNGPTKICIFDGVMDASFVRNQDYKGFACQQLTHMFLRKTSAHVMYKKMIISDYITLNNQV